MNTQTKIILACLMIVPAVTFAATDCRVIEFDDHYEAICEGDQKSPVSSQVRPTAPAKNHRSEFAPAQAAAAASPPAQGIPAAKPSPKAVKQIISYRQHRLQGSELAAKKTLRMQNIVAGRKNEIIVPQNDNPMQSDINVTPSDESSGKATD